MSRMLEAVVGPDGTARSAQIGASAWPARPAPPQRPTRSAAATGGYVATFVGFAPADDPQYVVAVDLERPDERRQGGQVAAPVFADIIALRAQDARRPADRHARRRPSPPWPTPPWPLADRRRSCATAPRRGPTGSAPVD